MGIRERLGGILLAQHDHAPARPDGLLAVSDDDASDLQLRDGSANR